MYVFIITHPQSTLLANWSCLLAPSKPNTNIKFRLGNASQALLTDTPSPLQPSAWADLLAQYPGGLRIYLPIIFRFRAKVGYKGPPTFILSENLASAFQDPTMIENKLKENLLSGHVIQLQKPPTPPFICLPLGLVLKHDRSWRRIDHLFHPQGKSVNDYIPDWAGEMRYTRFQEVLQLSKVHQLINDGDVSPQFCLIMRIYPNYPTHAGSNFPDHSMSPTGMLCMR